MVGRWSDQLIGLTNLFISRWNGCPVGKIMLVSLCHLSLHVVVILQLFFSSVLSELEVILDFIATRLISV